MNTSLLRAVLFLLLAGMATAEDPADPTLTTEEYAAAGVPAPGAAWSASDATAALKALAALVAGKPESLPRRTSSRSGEVFRRLVDAKNGAFESEAEVPVDKRIGCGVGFHGYATKLMKLYVQAMDKGQPLDGEVVDCIGSVLRHAVRLQGWIDERMPSLEKEEGNAKKMGALKSMREATAGAAENAMTLFEHRKLYGNESLVRYCGFLAETIPVLLPGLPAEKRKEIVARLKSLADVETDGDFKNALEGVVKVAEAATPGK